MRDSHGGPIDTSTLSIRLECTSMCPDGDVPVASTDPEVRGADVRVQTLDVALDHVPRDSAGEGGADLDDDRPSTEPESTLYYLRDAMEKEDWTMVRGLVAADWMVKKLRQSKDDFVASFRPACSRKKTKVVCSWNGDGWAYELSMKEFASGWNVTAMQFEPVE